MVVKNKKALLYLILSLLWMAVIFAFSQQAYSGRITEAYLHDANVPIRKLGHMCEFALLSLLYCQTLLAYRPDKPRRAVVLAMLLAIAWAALDEVHQSFVPGRSAAVRDVLVDTSGVMIALIGRVFAMRRRLIAAKKSE